MSEVDDSTYPPTVHAKCGGCGQSSIKNAYWFSSGKSQHGACIQCTHKKRKPAFREVDGRNQRQCIRCEDWLDAEMDFHNDKKRETGKYPWCRKCANKYTKKHKKGQRKARNPHFMRKSREWRDKANFGSATLFGELMAQQDNKCRICGKEHNDAIVPRFAIDHCHATNTVRGALCHDCNHALGCVKDNPEILRRMIEYLEVNAGILITSGAYARDSTRPKV